MLAPRGAAFLLLHLALQPCLGDGAQATPQGKWAPVAARTAGPGILAEPAVRAPLGRVGGDQLSAPLTPVASLGTSLSLWDPSQSTL